MDSPDSDELSIKLTDTAEITLLSIGAQVSAKRADDLMPEREDHPSQMRVYNASKLLDLNEMVEDLILKVMKAPVSHLEEKVRSVEN